MEDGPDPQESAGIAADAGEAPPVGSPTDEERGPGSATRRPREDANGAHPEDTDGANAADVSPTEPPTEP